MNHRKHVAAALCRIILPASLMVPLGACNIESHSNVRRSGTCVEGDHYARIELGKTTAEQVRALLGEPNESEKLSDGSELWKWNYSENVQKRGNFLIFHDSENKDITSRASVELKDGIVVKKSRSCCTDQNKSS